MKVLFYFNIHTLPGGHSSIVATDQSQQLLFVVSVDQNYNTVWAATHMIQPICKLTKRNFISWGKDAIMKIIKQRKLRPFEKFSTTITKTFQDVIRFDRCEELHLIGTLLD